MIPDHVGYFDNPVPEVLIDEDMDFCLTGDFVSERENIEFALYGLGFSIVSRPDENECYVIVGTFPSKRWKTPFAGTKILNAIKLKQKGYPVYIIREKHFIDPLAKKIAEVREKILNKKNPRNPYINKENPRSYSEEKYDVEQWWEQECHEKASIVEMTVQKAKMAWTIFWEGELEIHFGYLNGPSRYRTDVILNRVMRGKNLQFFLQGYSTHHGEEYIFFLDAVTSKIRVYIEKRYFHGMEFIGFIYTFLNGFKQSDITSISPARTKLTPEEKRIRDTARKAAMRAKPVTPEVLEAGKNIIAALTPYLPQEMLLEGRDRAKYYAIALKSGTWICRLHYKYGKKYIEIIEGEKILVNDFTFVDTFIPKLRARLAQVIR